ncbi:MAG: 3-phosphoshikimate 1-carboxyvinyltransferase [Victivallales bacterium]|nr:3-phosphoshikimate 1-carboxyvinyltransferase [Victivallales bacterium]
MKVKIKKSVLNGEIAVPGSKSHTIRALAAALMADGKSMVRAPLESADTLSVLEAVRMLGARAEKFPGRWEITGTGGRITVPGKTVDMGNSGTGLRILCGIAATGNKEIVFDGDASLRSRPMGQLTDALNNLGASIRTAAGKCPVRVAGPLKGGRTEIIGTSSQFLTSLLFACPFAEKDSEIIPVKLQEKPYVEITLSWLERLGVRFEAAADMTYFRIPGGQHFKAFDYIIPADFSTAAFPLGAGAVAGGRIRIKNLDFTDLQGDKAVFDYVGRFGARVERHDAWTEVSPGKLKGVDLDLNSTPDALPLLAVIAACAQGTSRFYNVAQARIKETDRISCMACELTKMGVKVQELPDGMIIAGSNGRLKGAELESHDDHRIAMALAVAALAADGESVINGMECAGVTYPGFIADFKALGGKINGID